MWSLVLALAVAHLRQDSEQPVCDANLWNFQTKDENAQDCALSMQAAFPNTVYDIICDVTNGVLVRSELYSVPDPATGNIPDRAWDVNWCGSGQNCTFAALNIAVTPCTGAGCTQPNKEDGYAKTVYTDGGSGLCAEGASCVFCTNPLKTDRIGAEAILNPPVGITHTLQRIVWMHLETFVGRDQCRICDSTDSAIDVHAENSWSLTLPACCLSR